ncbi:MAG: hypothetical protein HBSAPP01_26610 [Candidatus Brocadia sapporoensis]|nr:MAG: hypothetical protein HBSAPP01_26610 [Candidatus Brocadia sapporoensis]
MYGLIFIREVTRSMFNKCPEGRQRIGQGNNYRINPGGVKENEKEKLADIGTLPACFISKR